MYECFLTCPRGLEEQAQIDINSIIPESKINKGGIEFNATKSELYNVNLYSRIGMHLLIKLFDFECKNNDELYKQIHDYKWDKIIDINQSFLIKFKGQSIQFKNKNFTVLKIKDAIVDKIRKIRLSRPNIDKDNPDIIISIHIKDNKFSIYLDSSGISLHKRGYRNKIHRAMLNESLAAGLIMKTQWDKKTSFYDPMCGSGTFPIEAALMAYNIPPGLLREKFTFQKWKDYDSLLFKKILKRAKSKIKIDNNIKIYGYDNALSNIAIAMSSIKSLDLSNNIKIKKLDFLAFTPNEDSGIIIINPPYGERLKPGENQLNDLYISIGDIFKNNCNGYDCYVFTSNLESAKHIGLKSKSRLQFKNGNLDCRLIHYPIKLGSYK